MTTLKDSPTTVAQRASTVEATTNHMGGRALAILRVFVGFIFLWAFLDKTFGLGFTTSGAKAWINGGSPTSGFLGHVAEGPFRTFFLGLAGSPVVDFLFMLGMLAVGVALILGIGLRLSAIAGSLIMVLMWAAEWPMASLTFDGQPTASTNPFVDYHLIYALAIIVCALFAAGHTWGFGRIWESTSLVKRLPWLK
jgi:thiosulfate dehydrogenase (quinone) large subunit